MTDIKIDYSDDINKIMSNSLPGMEVRVMNFGHSDSYQVDVIDMFFYKNQWHRAHVQVNLLYSPLENPAVADVSGYEIDLALKHINHKLKEFSHRL